MEAHEADFEFLSLSWPSRILSRFISFISSMVKSGIGYGASLWLYSNDPSTFVEDDGATPPSFAPAFRDMARLSGCECV